MRRILVGLVLAAAAISVVVIPQAVAVEMCERVDVWVNGHNEWVSFCSPIRPNATSCYVVREENTTTGENIVVLISVCYPTQP